MIPPWHHIQDALLTAVLPSFAAAAAVLGVLVWVFGRRIAVPAAFLAACAGWAAGNATRAPLPWVPEKRVEYIPLIAAAAGLAAVLTRERRVPPGVGFAVWAAVLAYAVVKLMPAKLLAESAWLAPWFVLTTAATTFPLMRLSTRDPGGGVPALAAMSLFTAATVSIVAHSAMLTDVATIFGAALAGVAAVAFVAKLDASGAIPVAAAALSATAVCVYTDTYSDVPSSSFVLFATAPALAAAVVLPGLWKLTSRRLRVVQYLLVGVPLVVAVIRAVRAEPPDFSQL